MILLILTTVIIIGMFVYTVAKMIKSNFTDYIYLLVVEFIGIVIDFFAIVLGKQPSAFVYMLIYFFSVCIPAVAMLLERKDIYLSELVLFLPNGHNINKNTIINIINKHPESYVAHKKLAEFYEQNGEKEKAEDEYIKLIRIKPRDYKVYCKLAKTFCENNKKDEAIQTLQQLLKIKSDYSEASLLLGNILYEGEKFKEAILVYNQALQYNPKEYQLYYCLGMTYTRINDFNNAKECYKKAAIINSLQDISNLNIGQIYLIFEDYDNAEEYFYKTLDSDDDLILANSYFYLAKIRLIQKNESQAIQYANLAIEFDPKIFKRMEQDEIFITILGKLTCKSKDKINTKINEKEIETIEHLGKTFNVVETLTNNFSRSEHDIEKEID